MLQGEKSRTTLSEEKLSKVSEFGFKFKAAVENDLNLPQALAIVWEMAKSNIPQQDKLDLITDWDQVLGLNLLKPKVEKKIPAEIQTLINQRAKLRKMKKWEEADELRREINKRGFILMMIKLLARALELEFSQLGS